ncbi:hypothetical protein HKD37_15G042135 [Glycine soja]
MALARMEIKKFVGEINDFNLWRVKMNALLIHQGLDAVLSEEAIIKIEEKRCANVTNEQLLYL